MKAALLGCGETKLAVNFASPLFASLEGRSANTELFQKMKAVDPGDVAWDDVLKVHLSDLERAGIAAGELACEDR